MSTMRAFLVCTFSLLIVACSGEKSDEPLKAPAHPTETSEPALKTDISHNIIHPGKPGQPSRKISAAEANNLAQVLYTEADVHFMQGMIMHHAQALDMTALVEERSENPELIKLAKRIEISQKDEIESMQDWLNERNQQVTTIHAHHAHDSKLMPGMLTTQEMGSLKTAKTNGFDLLFLELMIKHHQGALTMVKELLKNHGAAQESIMFAFAADIKSDQTMEIERMADMISKLSPDPRVGLSAGYLDAEIASLNIQLITSNPRPPGFYQPKNPAGTALLKEEEEDDNTESTKADAPKPKTDEEKKLAKETKAREAKRKSNRKKGKDRESNAALFNYANTDLAFTNNIAVVGNYHGFNIYDLKSPESPVLLSSVVCPGGQGDVSIVDNLLIMSVEQTRGRLDCGLQGVTQKVSDERMRGIRIFDISDLTTPKQVSVVQTCRGSHTHTIVNDPDVDGNFYVYVSGTSIVREDKELAGCSDAAQDPNSSLFSIDVVEISTKQPEKARIVSQPRIFADAKSGSIAGLWKGGDHGRNTQRTNETNHCHDITVFPELNLAAGACSGNGILMDITDPLNPKRLDAATDKGFAYWHSATFNNDGTKVIFTDEWGGGAQPRCRASDPQSWGANAIFDIVDNKLEFKSYYKMKAPQSKKENCVAHNGSLIPVPGRDIMVQAWYQGGLSIFDFTDSANPTEIAYFDRGPVDKEHLIVAGYWSVYWHKGLVYGSEIARGLDVLKLMPSDWLTDNELAAASSIDPLIVNAQYQKQFKWPLQPEVALAYVDQLQRTKLISDSDTQELAGFIELGYKLKAANVRDQKVANKLIELHNMLKSIAPHTSVTALMDITHTLAKSI
jgi:uncharacterized protein (DUF305 family)